MRRPKKIAILGATGGCVDILDTINDVNAAVKHSEYECVGFLDDNPALWGKEVLNARVLGPFDSAAELGSDCYFVAGIGSPDNFWRKEAIISRLGIPRERFATVVHPTASVSTTASLGFGSVIYQNVTVTTNAHIGGHVLILPNTVISHEVVVGDYCIITGAVSISGAVSIGKACYLGTNSAVMPSVTIGDYCLVGMGSIVLDDVAENSVVVGNPAKLLRPTRQA